LSSENPISDSPNTFLITLDDTGQFAEIFVNGSLDFVQPLSTIDRINVLGLGGNDQLTVDSSHGLLALAEGIHFDGGGSIDTLSLTQTGGSPHTSDTYSVGPNRRKASVNSAMAPLTDRLFPECGNLCWITSRAASFTVNGTTASNIICSTLGPGGGSFTGPTGKITIDNVASIEFNNKTSLTINSLGDDDAISLDNSNTPAGLSGITINGGDPTLPSGDTLKYLTAGSINPSAAGAGHDHRGRQAHGPFHGYRSHHRGRLHRHSERSRPSGHDCGRSGLLGAGRHVLSSPTNATISSSRWR
jgi:hypothetical protein